MPAFDLGFAPSRHRSPKPGYNGTSMQAFFDAFPNDAACLHHLFKVRFGLDPACPRCGGHGRWRPHAVQKHFFHPCGGILSPMTGTLFSRSRIPLQLWFYALLHFANSAESIASPFLARQIGISERSAFRVSQRIRMHLAALDTGNMLGRPGHVVMARLVKILRVVNNRRHLQNSAMVLLLSDHARVDTTVMIKPRQKSLRSVLRNKVHPLANVHTDCYSTHRAMSGYGTAKPIAEFSPVYYHDNPQNIDLSHGFSQYFLSSFADQFRGVERKYVWLYLKEYEFRYNRRRSGHALFPDMVARFPGLDAEDLARLRMAHFVGEA